MTETTLNPQTLKDTIREAVRESLQQELRPALEEIFEDTLLARDIDEGLRSGAVSRSEVMAALDQVG